jgi:hypothetical protein
VAAGEHTEAPWRTHGRTSGKATAAAGVGGTRGEGEGKGAERRRGRTAPRGDDLRRRQR